MPSYKVRDPQSGRTVTLRGDSPPSEAELEQVFAALSEGESSRGETAERITPEMIGVGNAARRAAVRVGEQVATSPNLGRAVSAASRPASQMVGRAVGVSGGLPGYIAGETLTNPAVGRAVESGIRGGAGMLAKVASSPLARAVTGLPGMLATLPASEAGDRPAGETPARTADRQASFAHQFKDQVNREAGRQVITGNTADEIIASIARYRGSR